MELEISQFELLARIQDLVQQVNSLNQVVDQLKNQPASPQATKTTHIGSDCQLAAGIRIFSTDGKEVEIGDNVNIYRGAEIFGPVSIGSRTFINRDAYLRSGTNIGANVNIGPFSRFITDSHEIADSRKRAGKNITKDIVVGDGTWIGASVTVLGGVTIGSGSIVAAGAVVTTDIPPNSVAAGIPARVVKSLSD